MSQLYVPLSSSERQGAVKDFLEFLRGRDGEVEPLAHRLSKREAYFQRLDQQPVRSTVPVDQAQFDCHHRADGKPAAGLDDKMLWLLATAKLNRGERYGVELDLKYRQSRGRIQLDDPMTFINVEEFYHTRILLDVLRIFGLEIEMLPPSSRAIRWVTKAMIYLPPPIALPLAMAGEVTGVIAFFLMRDKAAEIFKDEPAVLAQITSLYNEILVDEIGHVTYARTRLGRLGLKMAQLSQPAVTKSIFDNVSELRVLFTDAEIKEAMRQVDRILTGATDLDRPADPAHRSPTPFTLSKA